MKYFVDYGHGGSDSGAVSNGIYEKNVNRLIGERVKYHLERHNQKVVLTRTTDEYRSLDEIVSALAKAGYPMCRKTMTDYRALAVNLVSTYLWGYTAKDTKEILDKFVIE